MEKQNQLALNYLNVLKQLKAKHLIKTLQVEQQNQDSLLKIVLDPIMFALSTHRNLIGVKGIKKWDSSKKKYVFNKIPDSNLNQQVWGTKHWTKIRDDGYKLKNNLKLVQATPNLGIICDDEFSVIDYDKSDFTANNLPQFSQNYFDQQSMFYQTSSNGKHLHIFFSTTIPLANNANQVHFENAGKTLTTDIRTYGGYCVLASQYQHLYSDVVCQMVFKANDLNDLAQRLSKVLTPSTLKMLATKTASEIAKDLTSPFSFLPKLPVSNSKLEKTNPSSIRSSQAQIKTNQQKVFTKAASLNNLTPAETLAKSIHPKQNALFTRSEYNFSEQYLNHLFESQADSDLIAKSVIAESKRVHKYIHATPAKIKISMNKFGKDFTKKRLKYFTHYDSKRYIPGTRNSITYNFCKWLILAGLSDKEIMQKLVQLNKTAKEPLSKAEVMITCQKVFDKRDNNHQYTGIDLNSVKELEKVLHKNLIDKHLPILQQSKIGLNKTDFDIDKLKLERDACLSFDNRPYLIVHYHNKAYKYLLHKRQSELIRAHADIQIKSMIKALQDVQIQAGLDYSNVILDQHKSTKELLTLKPYYFGSEAIISYAPGKFDSLLDKNNQPKLINFKTISGTALCNGNLLNNKYNHQRFLVMNGGYSERVQTSGMYKAFVKTRQLSDKLKGTRGITLLVAILVYKFKRNKLIKSRSHEDKESARFFRFMKHFDYRLNAELANSKDDELKAILSEAKDFDTSLNDTNSINLLKKNFTSAQIHIINFLNLNELCWLFDHQLDSSRKGYSIASKGGCDVAKSYLQQIFKQTASKFRKIKKNLNHLISIRTLNGLETKANQNDLFQVNIKKIIAIRNHISAKVKELDTAEYYYLKKDHEITYDKNGISNISKLAPDYLQWIVDQDIKLKDSKAYQKRDKELDDAVKYIHMRLNY